MKTPMNRDEIAPAAPAPEGSAVVDAPEPVPLGCGCKSYCSARCRAVDAALRERRPVSAIVEALRAPEEPASGATTHELKVWPMYYEALASGAKTFEYRKDDREPRYAVGDVLVLHEYIPPYRAETEHEWSKQFAGDYTGRECLRRVAYVARGGVIPDGFCVMSVVGASSSVPAPAAPECAGPPTSAAGDLVDMSIEDLRDLALDKSASLDRAMAAVNEMTRRGVVKPDWASRLLRAVFEEGRDHA